MDTNDAVAVGAAQVGSGRLLSGHSLLAALQQQDHIFREGSWDPAQIKGAGYDLRLAGDFLVIPDGPGASTFQTIRPGNLPADQVRLAPGDSALISTQEKFSVDFDISVLLGPKFRWSAQGLLVLHGMVAHPGYGREKTATGDWVPSDDERLYVIVANVGPQDITINVGDPIAYAQFFEVEQPAAPRAIDNRGFEYLARTLFNEKRGSAAPGLAYFRNVRDVANSVKGLADRVDTESTVLNERINSALTVVDRVRNTTDNVVVFGVFLISATILGVVLTTLTDVIKDLPGNLSPARLTLISALAALYGVAVVVGVAMVARSAGRMGNQPGSGQPSSTPNASVGAQSGLPRADEAKPNGAKPAAPSEESAAAPAADPLPEGAS